MMIESIFCGITFVNLLHIKMLAPTIDWFNSYLGQADIFILTRFMASYRFSITWISLHIRMCRSVKNEPVYLLPCCKWCSQSCHFQLQLLLLIDYVVHPAYIRKLTSFRVNRFITLTKMLSLFSPSSFEASSFTILLCPA